MFESEAEVSPLHEQYNVVRRAPLYRLRQCTARTIQIARTKMAEHITGRIQICIMSEDTTTTVHPSFFKSEIRNEVKTISLVCLIRCSYNTKAYC